MKHFPWIVVVILVVVILYLYMKKPTSSPSTVVPNANNYAAGLALVNLINNTKCGKNGNPPCTVKDLQNSGWTPAQISAAQAGSQSLSTTLLCEQYGINC